MKDTVKRFRERFAEDTPVGILYWHGNAEEIESFLTQEVDRAREETIKEVKTKLNKAFKANYYVGHDKLAKTDYEKGFKDGRGLVWQSIINIWNYTSR